MRIGVWGLFPNKICGLDLVTNPSRAIDTDTPALERSRTTCNLLISEERCDDAGHGSDAQPNRISFARLDDFKNALSDF
jgi:hypothetical protein